MSGKSNYLSQPTLERIALTFGVSISAIIGEAHAEQPGKAVLAASSILSHGFRPESGESFVSAELVTLKVIGAVLSSSAWSETVFLHPGREEFVSFNMPSLYGAKAFALRLMDPSMDILLPTGAILGCVTVEEYIQQIRSGDIVIMMSRNAGGLFQASVRQYLVDGESHYLVTQSSDQRYADKAKLQSPLATPAAGGYHDFFIHSVVLSYAADLPALRR